MRLEVQEYMRASAKLFGLSCAEDALTLLERDAIVSFAQEVERKFLPSRHPGDGPLLSPLPNTPLIDSPEGET